MFSRVHTSNHLEGIFHLVHDTNLSGSIHKSHVVKSVGDGGARFRVFERVHQPEDEAFRVSGFRV